MAMPEKSDMPEPAGETDLNRSSRLQSMKAQEAPLYPIGVPVSPHLVWFRSHICAIEGRA